MESKEAVDSMDFLKKVRLLLLTLYQKGLSFPLYAGNSDKDADDPLGENYFIVLKQIENKIGDMVFYTTFMIQQT